MSLSDIYQKSKNEKKSTMDKVVLASHANEIKTNLGSLYENLMEMKKEMDQMKLSITTLEKTDMVGFQQKHANMKKAYNDLVTSYTEMQTDINSVILDLSKRVGEIESKFHPDL